MTDSPARLEELEALLATLSREPDFDAPELQAYDAADLLLLERAVELCSGSVDVLGGGLAIIGDRHGALTLGAAYALGATGIRVHQDPLLSERALAANAARLRLAGSYKNFPLGEGLLRGAKLVLLQLPKSLAELEEIAWNIACCADTDVTVLAGGRDKHMNRSMNEMLSRYFTEVQAGLGWRKARVITARVPLMEVGGGAGSADPRFPEHSGDPALSFELFAYGATFGGATLDHGSRLLLHTLREQPPAQPPGRIVDIGCGNGGVGGVGRARVSDG